MGGRGPRPAGRRIQAMWAWPNLYNWPVGLANLHT